MPAFTLATMKLKKTDIGRAKGHNCREHPTESQIRRQAWFSHEGRHELVPWNDAKLEEAKQLAKRKDAVVAISLIVQVGNQTEWRNAPTDECPEGEPVKGAKETMNRLCKGAKAWALEEFGADNIVSMELHTDESSPHVHLVVTPIKDGKLQAKNWLDGRSRVASLRQRACAAMQPYLPCTYTPGNGKGGKLHDPALSAGQNSPQPGLLDRVAMVKPLQKENQELKARVAALEQTVFSRQKARYNAARAAEAEAATKAAEAAEAARNAAEARLRAVQGELVAVERKAQEQAREIERLKGANENLADQCNELEARLQELEPSSHKPSA